MERIRFPPGGGDREDAGLLQAGTQPPLLSLDDSEMRQYFGRVTVEGELKAMKWLLARHPQE